MYSYRVGTCSDNSFLIIALLVKKEFKSKGATDDGGKIDSWQQCHVRGAITPQQGDGRPVQKPANQVGQRWKKE